MRYVGHDFTIFGKYAEAKILREADNTKSIVFCYIGFRKFYAMFIT
jgi:hypothetical protein